MRNTTAVVDLHGPVANLWEAQRKALETVTKIHLDPAKFGGGMNAKRTGGSFEFIDTNGVVHKVSKSDLDIANKKIFGRDYLNRVPLISGARDGLCSLKEHFDNVLLISKAGNRVDGSAGVSEKLMWDFARVHDLPIDGVIHDATSDAHEKIGYMAQADLVIDNERGILERVLCEGTPNAIWMLPEPGTTGCDVINPMDQSPPGIHLCYGWDSVISHIESLDIKISA